MDFPSKLSGKQGMKASLLVLVRSLPSFDFMTVNFERLWIFCLFYKILIKEKVASLLSLI